MLAAQQERYERQDGLNPLLRAAVLGNVTEVQRLLDSGVNVNECNEIGQTALLAAALANNTDVCKVLLDNGAQVNVKDIGGFTSLHLTTDVATVNLLLDYAKDENKDEVVNAKSKNGRTPLHEAAVHGPAEKAVKLLYNNALADSEDIHGNTPLHYALARSGDGDIDIIEALLEARADVNKRNSYFQTPLAIACKQHQFMRKTIPILLKAGADPNMQTNEGNTAVHMLFLGTNLFESDVPLDLLKEVVEANKACLNTTNLYGQLPIHGALSKRKMEEMATWLLQFAPDTANKCDEMGRTILHLACAQNHIGILKQYIDNSNFEAMVNKPDKLGRTILHYSCIFSKDGQSLKLILESKVFLKFELIDCFGLTAYQYVQIRHADEMVALTKLLDDRLSDDSKKGLNHLKKYFHAEDTNTLDNLLSQAKVTDADVMPASLRPVENIKEYINSIWEACKTPVKDLETFYAQREMVERFMKNLIEIMKAYDARFAGHLVMRGSAYEETIADARGDYDYMLDIDGLSSICFPKEEENDPPGYIRLQLIPGVNAGSLKDFFDDEGFLNADKILSAFSISVMFALHQPSLWMSSRFDFFPKLKVTWKERPALSISCRMFHESEFVPVSIDFLPAVHCKSWWPAGNSCNKYLDETSILMGCQMIIKPPNVPFYQHAKFGNPHHYVKMSFSEAETRLFQRCHQDVRKAFIVSKLLLDRQVEIPWSILQPESDSVFRNSKLNILTKNLITTYLLKQSLFNVLEENAYIPDQTNINDDNTPTWVQRLFTRYRKALIEGNLPSVFQTNINHLHTFQPDDGKEHIRYVLVQILCHSLLEGDIPLQIDYDVPWYRRPTKFECTIHSRIRYLKQTLQCPEELE